MHYIIREAPTYFNMMDLISIDMLKRLSSPELSLVLVFQLVFFIELTVFLRIFVLTKINRTDNMLLLVDKIGRWHDK